MKIKLILVNGNYDYDDNYTARLGEGISDWEEVTQDEYEFINANLWRLKLTNRNRADDIIIVRQDDISVADRIVGIKKEIEKLAKQEEKRKNEEKLKREEAAAKRAEKKLLKERQILERLIKNNPDIIEQYNKENI